MKKVFPIVGSISALIIALSIGYYFVIFLPQKEEGKKADSNRNKALLDICLSTTETDYFDYWNKLCEKEKLEDDCGLSKYSADIANEFKKDSKEECFKKYPQK